ncbi:hypothetical protein PoB_003298100 [Plakobranchus ocellatus]|uniref:Uncharacterized protein n=1 Tax=Plakobranchus ocellatus TaxID=259542 RepID=A0AAV4A5G3_9GAST|nr:hypothetical protein PoB_003298100 [Plakobranchus ocellatus]
MKECHGKKKKKTSNKNRRTVLDCSPTKLRNQTSYFGYIRKHQAIQDLILEEHLASEERGDEDIQPGVEISLITINMKAKDGRNAEITTLTEYI